MIASDSDIRLVAQCPKCGLCSEHPFEYLGPGARVNHGPTQSFEGECLVRQCSICDYRYSVLTADTRL